MGCEHLAHVLDRPRGGVEREAELAERWHRVGGELDAEGGAPVDNVVVELGEHLDEVEAVADEVEAELAQVVLGEKEDL